MSGELQRRPVALVTGARRGIGRTVAVALAAGGFDIAAVDLVVAEDLEASVARARAEGARAEPFACDIAAIDGHAALLDAVEARLGPVQALVNNAGVSVMQRGDLLDVSPASYDRCMAVNARGTFFLTQAVARRMLDQQGGPAAHLSWPRSIVTVTSSNAVAASVQRGEYCASKAAAAMGSLLFAVRLAPAGIGVYDIQPGLIATEMTAPSRGRYDALIEAGGTAIPRWGTAEEVARVVLTAVQGHLPYSVGQPIRVDGGLLVQKF